MVTPNMAIQSIANNPAPALTIGNRKFRCIRFKCDPHGVKQIHINLHWKHLTSFCHLPFHFGSDLCQA
ncbi:hypothetical protein SAMN05216567_11050 [Variovorax sp. OK605]|nr:hypothetical protein SAMN05216567_11050 [Variovorax sp. OK605]